MLIKMIMVWIVFKLRGTYPLHPIKILKKPFLLKDLRSFFSQQNEFFLNMKFYTSISKNKKQNR